MALRARRSLASFEELPIACCGRVRWKSERRRVAVDSASLAYMRRSLIMHVIY